MGAICPKLYNDNRELNKDSDGEVLRGEGEEILLEEVEKAIDDMKNGKTMVISRTQGLSCKLVLNGKEIEKYGALCT